MADEKKILQRVAASIANREIAQSESARLAEKKEAEKVDPNKPIPLPTLSEALANAKKNQ